MPKAVYSPEAENDLGQLVEYIAQDNLLAAMKWLDQTRAPVNCSPSNQALDNA